MIRPVTAIGMLHAVTAIAVILIGRLVVHRSWLDTGRWAGDVTYYFEAVTALPVQGIDRTLVEYPVPVTWLLAVPEWFAGGDHDRYVAVFMALMIATDLAFCWLLWRRTPRPLLAIGVWSAFVAAMGPIVYLRFDIVPAALVGAALLFHRRRSALAGTLVAAGAALKLWPAAVMLLLFVSPHRRRLAAGFLVTGATLAAASVITTGWDRTASALTWQEGRGLQLESVWATPILFERLAGDPVDIFYSEYQAVEVSSRSLQQWLAWSTLAGLVCAVVTVLVFRRGWRTWHGSDTIASAFWMAAAVTMLTALILIGNKTLSAQYVVWLGAPAVVMVAFDGSARRRWTVATLLVAIGLLTQLVYPTWYPALWSDVPQTERVRATWTLATRNLLLLVSGLGLVLTSVLTRPSSTRPSSTR